MSIYFGTFERGDQLIWWKNMNLVAGSNRKSYIAKASPKVKISWWYNIVAWPVLLGESERIEIYTTQRLPSFYTVYRKKYRSSVAYCWLCWCSVFFFFSSCFSSLIHFHYPSTTPIFKTSHYRFSPVLVTLVIWFFPQGDQFSSAPLGYRYCVCVVSISNCVLAIQQHLT